MHDTTLISLVTTAALLLAAALAALVLGRRWRRHDREAPSSATRLAQNADRNALLRQAIRAQAGRDPGRTADLAAHLQAARDHLTPEALRIAEALAGELAILLSEVRTQLSAHRAAADFAELIAWMDAYLTPIAEAAPASMPPPPR